MAREEKLLGQRKRAAAITCSEHRAHRPWRGKCRTIRQAQDGGCRWWRRQRRSARTPSSTKTRSAWLQPQPQPQPTGDIVTVQEPPPPAPIPVMPYAIPYPLVPAPPPINQYVVDGQYLVGSQPPMMMVDQPYQPYAGGSVAPMGMMPGMSVPPMMPGMSVPPMPPAMMPYSPPSVFGTQQYQLAV
mmetsp:Transcript_22737/g.53950  ORF Transcript_22737/g.53950 Transcript_22737/m.53950 type:complete len:186 (+) Transcript_22737:863-1420(+)